MRVSRKLNFNMDKEKHPTFAALNLFFISLTVTIGVFLGFGEQIIDVFTEASVGAIIVGIDIVIFFLMLFFAKLFFGRWTDWPIIVGIILGITTPLFILFVV